MGETMKPVEIDYDGFFEDVSGGMNYSEAARKYGISATTATRLAKKAGINTRSRSHLTKSEEEWEDLWKQWEVVRVNVLKGLNKYSEKDYMLVIRRFRGCFCER